MQNSLQDEQGSETTVDSAFRCDNPEELLQSFKNIASEYKTLSPSLIGRIVDVYSMGEMVQNVRQVYARLKRAGLADVALAVAFYQVNDIFSRPAEAVRLLRNIRDSLRALDRQYGFIDYPEDNGSNDLLYNHLYGLMLSRQLAGWAPTMEDFHYAFSGLPWAQDVVQYFAEWLWGSNAMQAIGNHPELGGILSDVLRGFLTHTNQAQMHLLIQVITRVEGWHAALESLAGLERRPVNTHITSWGSPLQYGMLASQQQLAQSQQRQSSLQQAPFLRPDAPTFSSAPPVALPLQSAGPAAGARKNGNASTYDASDTIAVAQHPFVAPTPAVGPVDDQDTIRVANPRSKAATRGARQYREY